MPCVVVDLFCGIGGLTKGLELSGINVAAGIDINETCKYAYERNNNARFIHADITNLTSEEVLNLYPDDCIRALVGCAPCQPFSKYTKRYRKDGHTDDKWRLLYSFSRIIEETNPHIVSMENVPELSKEKVFQDFIDMLVNLNYYVNWQIVYCPDYGVPQSRNRLVLLASQMGEINLIPPLYTIDRYRTVRQSIGDLPPIKDGETNAQDSLHCSCRLSKINRLRIRQSVQGGTWRDWDESLQLKCHKKDSGKTYPSVYGRMRWDEPAPTITTQFYGYGNGRFGHPEQNRALSIREGAILQSFPRDYAFLEEGSILNKTALGIHIGNAVPVELGRAIGISINQHIEEVENNG
ncbi:DNA (cytosine-5-)-methyltransferase [Dehalobacter sp. TeCB1]|uniref:DNA cytosine methyltransferase n=1 Tax=Dehalobacter sp. TeCB1 TaxID=1843715 RepID=UPI00083B832B|nr:DNA (cytosine-5-)-methyltransferase [Dehalobacter sp. TeCB1]OCZ49912.1 DNA (cytosine-5-)-methyltransferase [Dehalobacter sp. TeCB1]